MSPWPADPSDPAAWLGWTGVERLERGTPRQRRAVRALHAAGVMTALAAWPPTVVGTFPLRCDIETSDVDVICETADVDAFEHAVVAAFGDCEAFRSWRRPYRGAKAVVALFRSEGLWVEVFGADEPVVQQTGFEHMIVEARLLTLTGPRAHRAIRRLKRGGLKTEPAFARYYRLPGDPYLTLLDLYGEDDATLELVVRAAGRLPAWTAALEQPSRP